MRCLEVDYEPGATQTPLTGSQAVVWVARRVGRGGDQVMLLLARLDVWNHVDQEYEQPAMHHQQVAERTEPQRTVHAHVAPNRQRRPIQELG